MTLHPRTTQLRSTPPTIQFLKWCHPNAGVIAIIIRELYQRQMVIPFTSEVNHTRSQHVLQCFNGALCLPICLRMKGSANFYLHAQAFLERSLEMQSKLSSSI